VVVRDAGEVTVSGCRIDAADVGLSVEVGCGPECRVRISASRLNVRAASGAGLSLWVPEERAAPPVRMDLEGNTIRAGRTAALRGMPAGLTVNARDNHFAFRSALMSYTGCADGDAWRGTVWQGGGNVYEGPASWLWVNDRPVPLERMKDEG
jgi:hypothetical protein